MRQFTHHQISSGGFLRKHQLHFFYAELNSSAILYLKK
jgi:hypothetical protein